MNKADLIDFVAEHTGESRAGASRMVDAVLLGIVEGVRKHERLSIVRFGTFRKKTRKARETLNPMTKAPVVIKPCTTIGFTPSEALKNGV